MNPISNAVSRSTCGRSQSRQSAGKPLDKTVDLEVIAKETHGFSGADLANLVNEAAILTARRNKTVIGMDEMEESIDRIIAGPQKKSRKISQQEKPGN